MRCGIAKWQWDIIPSLKLLDACVNKLELLSSKHEFERIKTNHSLCVTSATRLFQSGVDEHSSREGVSYKKNNLGGVF